MIESIDRQLSHILSPISSTTNQPPIFKLLIGLFKNNNISDLWKSKQYIDLRNDHKSKLRKKISPCNRCSVI